MAFYLKKFENHTQYDNYINGSGAMLPNVSLTVDNNTVHYNPLSPTPPTPTHDFVEIGGLKWATMNIGAESVTDSGLYFQWGDTQGYTADQVGSGEGQKYFGWQDYKYCSDGSGSQASMTKYTGNGGSGSGSGSGSGFEGDGLFVLEPVDDAVTAAWGGSWRMPTEDEYIALGNAVTTAWTADYEGTGVSGLVLTDKTDSSKVLFFPAAGYCGYGSVSGVGSDGGYWSSSLYGGSVSGAYDMDFDSGSVYWGYGRLSRYDGFPVRGVLGENN